MNYDKNPELARKLARRQKGLRKKLRKQANFIELDFDDGGHISSQDFAEASWDLEFDNYDEDSEHERKKGG